MLTIEERNFPEIARWFSERGGIKVWNSINLSNPGKQVITPLCSLDGRPRGKPSWEFDESDCEIIIDPAQVQVSIDKEVKRFPVAIRRSGNGFYLKCTDASSRKIRRAVEAAGPGAFYRFDFESQEAVIFASSKVIPFLDYGAIYAESH
jgi:hypothetical protein